MVKRVKNPSRAAVSAASVKGNAGPGVENKTGPEKVNSQNNQFRRITE